jgi:ketosteroid isomerase-like protein
MLSLGTNREEGEMSNQNVALVRSFAEAFKRGDTEAALATMSEDVVVHESDSVPYPGSHRGKQEFLDLLQSFLAVWDLQGDMEQDIAPAGEDRVLVLARFDAIAKATGKPLEIRIAEVYTVRDGMIAEILVYYWDTHAMVVATGGASVPQGEPA